MPQDPASQELNLCGSLHIVRGRKSKISTALCASCCSTGQPADWLALSISPGILCSVIPAGRFRVQDLLTSCQFWGNKRQKREGSPSRRPEWLAMETIQMQENHTADSQFLVLDSLGETLPSLKWALAVSPHSLGPSTLQVIKRTAQSLKCLSSRKKKKKPFSVPSMTPLLDRSTTPPNSQIFDAMFE